MKKSIVVLTGISWVLAIVAVLLFMFQGGVLGGLYSPSIILTVLPSTIEMFNFSSFGFANVVFFALFGATAVLFVVHLVMILLGKHYSSIPFLVSWVLLGTLCASASVVIFKEGFFPDVSLTGGDVVHDTGAFAYFVALFFADKISAGQLAFAYLPIILMFFALVFATIAEIQDLVLVAQQPALPKREYAKDEITQDKVVVVREDHIPDSPSSEEIRGILRDEVLAASPSSESEPSPSFNPQPPFEEERPRSTRKDLPPLPPSPAASVITGPLLVQYINTFSPDGEVTKTEKSYSQSDILSGNVPDSFVAKEKLLSADEIRKIVKEEFKSLLEPEKTEETPKTILVEPTPEAALSAEEIRRIIADELNVVHDKQRVEAKLKSEEEAKRPAESVRDVIKEELAAYKKAEEQILLVKREEEEKKMEEAKKNILTPGQIRQIIAEELCKQMKAEAKDGKVPLSNEVFPAVIKEESVPLSQETPKERIPEPLLSTTDVVEKDGGKPSHEPGLVADAKPVKPVALASQTIARPSDKRVVGAINPNLPPHEKIIRIPFPTRMLKADKELKGNYNELKSEIMSYGVKSRVSNSGDTFRLHKVTFVKLTIAGKGLKLYFALNPKDYADSTLPIQDAGHKGIYKDIPLVFKVKSELSVRRAKQLIADVMDKGSLEQGKIEPNNWAEALKDYKEQGSDEED